MKPEQPAALAHAPQVEEQKPMSSGPKYEDLMAGLTTAQVFGLEFLREADAATCARLLAAGRQTLPEYTAAAGRIALCDELLSTAPRIRTETEKVEAGRATAANGIAAFWAAKDN